MIYYFNCLIFIFLEYIFLYLTTIRTNYLTLFFGCYFDKKHINPFQANFPFLFPLKHQQSSANIALKSINTLSEF